MKHPQKILVRTPNWVGDHVMARAFYRGLRAEYSSSKIVFLCSESIFGFDDSEFCSEKLLWSENSRKKLVPFLDFVKNLRLHHFDLALSLPHSLSGALLFYLSRIPVRAGFRGDGNQIFLTHSLSWNGAQSKLHKSAQYFELLNELRAKNLKPSPEPSFQERERASTILIAPGASIGLREWEAYPELIVKLLERYPKHKIKLVGTKREAHWGLKIQSHPRVESLFGTTNLTQLVEMCGYASLVIGNDSGVVHLAATLGGAPTIALFGPGTPGYVAPQGKQVKIIRESFLSCSPCEKPYCRAPYGYKKCMELIRVDQVLEGVKSLLPL